MKSQEGEWVNLLAEVFDRLEAKNTITYDFENVTFGADRTNMAKYAPTGRIKVNGKITINAK